MKSSSLRFGIAALLSWGAVELWTPNICRAQYDTPQGSDTDATKSAVDTTQVADTSRAQSKAAGAPEENEEQAAQPQATPEKAVVDLAVTWLRRVLYRGVLDASVIGAYTQYQVTSWSETVGSYGPVEARLTISYLGTSQFRGKDAEWLQAVVQTVEEEPMIVEFDLLLPQAARVAEAYRVLYRVNRGDMHSLDLNLPPDKIDYDREDRPAVESTEDLRLYSGTFVCEKLHGAGAEGADVMIYRSDKVKPMNIVRLGYGSQGLTYTGGGNDAAPRFNIPPPPAPR